MRIRTLTIGAVAVAAALTLAGCSGGGDRMDGMDHGASNAPHSADASAGTTAAAQADIDFAMNMLAHHEQAVEMSDVLLGKQGIDAEVAQLAERIKAAQQPEIDTMKQWLTEWGQDPEAGGMDHGGMDHGDGMMSADDMAALEKADGATASRLFLEQMIVHHEGAVDMAQTALDDAQNPDVLDLAQQVIDDQTAEIATMEELLGQL